MRCRQYWSKTLVAISTLILIGTLFSNLSRWHAGLPEQAQPDEEGCLDEILALRTLELSPTIWYHRQCIKIRQVRGKKRNSTIQLERDLFTDAAQVDLGQCTEDRLPTCQSPIVIDVPAFKPRLSYDTSSLLVGCATNKDRLNRGLPQVSRWLSNAKAILVVIIQDSENYEGLIALQNRAAAFGITAILVPDPLADGDHDESNGHAQRHFAVARALHLHKTTAHKWFAVIDDDTFFPSLPSLLEALRPYDPSLPWYIGALTEDMEAMRRFGYMAYGGAGIFLSAPLLETLHAHYEECVLAGSEGDALYRDCIYRVTSPPVHLTQLPGLHQLDFYGDVSGWYEGGIHPILSLHHYNSWHEFPVQYAHLVTEIAGPESFLQRYRFKDNAVLSNGFSIARYPHGLENVDFERVEDTFLYKDDRFDWSLGQLRPPLMEGTTKLSWKLEHSVVMDDGSVRQFYVKRRAIMSKEDEMLDNHDAMDSVFELVWKR